LRYEITKDFVTENGATRHFIGSQCYLFRTQSSLEDDEPMKREIPLRTRPFVALTNRETNQCHSISLLLEDCRGIINCCEPKKEFHTCRCLGFKLSDVYFTLYIDAKYGLFERKAQADADAVERRRHLKCSVVSATFDALIIAVLTLHSECCLQLCELARSESSVRHLAPSRNGIHAGVPGWAGFLLHSAIKRWKTGAMSELPSASHPRPILRGLILFPEVIKSYGRELNRLS